MHAVKATLAANISCIFQPNPCLQWWHLVNPRNNRGMFQCASNVVLCSFSQMDAHFLPKQKYLNGCDFLSLLKDLLYLPFAFYISGNVG